MGWDLSTGQFAALAVAALLVGFSKTAVSGANTISLAVFAAVLPARASTGVLLPILIAGDVLAVLTYRRHAHWPTLWRLFPAVAGGVVAGTVFLMWADDAEAVQNLSSNLRSREFPLPGALSAKADGIERRSCELLGGSVSRSKLTGRTASFTQSQRGRDHPCARTPVPFSSRCSLLPFWEWEVLPMPRLPQGPWMTRTLRPGNRPPPCTTSTDSSTRRMTSLIELTSASWAESAHAHGALPLRELRFTGAAVVGRGFVAAVQVRVELGSFERLRRLAVRGAPAWPRASGTRRGRHPSDVFIR
ncbi:sulfite exporter TauE/SafE family protein [Streptomyces sp. KL118A]|uniref:sulfite exporter TauE/SafE family protein n=1 Tax=Streptomyces sp. KL118A TaxID=3045153 RepID=UPI00278C4882|nr:sulfite exporter TauE/SafE family protein [Streptomyces sp. KL118A]